MTNEKDSAAIFEKLKELSKGVQVGGRRREIKVMEENCSVGHVKRPFALRFFPLPYTTDVEGVISKDEK